MRHDVHDGRSGDESGERTTERFAAQPADPARMIRDVSRDMEGIFGAAASSPMQSKTTGADRVRSIIRDRASKGRTSGLLTPALGLCGLLIMGAMVWLATPAPQNAQAPALAQSARTVAVAERPAPPPQAMLAQAAEPARAPEPSATEPSASGPSKAKTSADAAKATPVKSTERAERVKSGAKDRRVAETERACARMNRHARARCMRPHILRADREMRSAYASATRAGVDRRTLKSYRNRWSRVLEESNSDPVYVTASLEEMTRRLHAKRARL